MNNHTTAAIIQSQQLLEQNEDIIAAIVENLQLGRLDDCMKHYSILQTNLVALAEELDNFPAGDINPYETLHSFPDEIMRKDVLDDLQPYGSRPLPRPPLAPPCQKCATDQIPADVCRINYRHIEPASKFSATEREEFIHCVQILSARKSTAVDDKPKRNYKRWNANEMHSLFIGIILFGFHNITELKKVLENRTDGQIRSFISKHVRNKSIPPLQELLSKPPKGYQPPPALVPLFAEFARSGSASRMTAANWQQQTRGSNKPASSDPTAIFKPRFAGHDFSSLISMATTGVPTYPHFPNPTYWTANMNSANLSSNNNIPINISTSNSYSSGITGPNSYSTNDNNYYNGSSSSINSSTGGGIVVGSSSISNNNNIPINISTSNSYSSGITGPNSYSTNDYNGSSSSINSSTGGGIVVGSSSSSSSSNHHHMITYMSMKSSIPSGNLNDQHLDRESYSPNLAQFAPPIPPSIHHDHVGNSFQTVVVTDIDGVAIPKKQVKKSAPPPFAKQGMNKLKLLQQQQQQQLQQQRVMPMKNTNS